MLTPKQEAFVLAYIETGNASEAYKRSYNAAKMKDETVRVKAAELLKNGNITVRLSELRAQAAETVVLNRAWVLERLMRNAQIAMGEEKVKITVPKAKDSDETREIEVTDRDAAAANKALELLGKTDEVRLFAERIELMGKDGGPIETAEVSPRERFLGRISSIASRLGENGGDSRSNGQGH